MSGDRTKDRLLAGVIAVGFGALTCLEAYGITRLGRGTHDTPRWVTVLIGVMFIACGLVAWVGLPRRTTGLFASVIIASMGVVFGWIGLVGDAGGFSGGASAVAELSGFPLQRIAFGLGALFCFAGAAVAFASFAKARSD
jgi:hypothetical protein